MAPRAKTPAVCEAVTMSPSRKAWRAVPREPTRYAATIVLPWPGSSACRAPSPNAMKAAVMRNQRLMLRVVINSVKALRGVACWLACKCKEADAAGVAGTTCLLPEEAGLGTCFRTAGPSTPLRSGRDDKLLGSRELVAAAELGSRELVPATELRSREIVRATELSSRPERSGVEGPAVSSLDVSLLSATG